MTIGNAKARRRVGNTHRHPKAAQGETSRKAAALVRQRQAIEMKAAGASYSQIGAALGVSGKTAFYDVQQAAMLIDGETMAIAERHREVELRAMDLVRRQMVPILQGQKEAPADRSRAGMVIVRTSERKAKMLGLDAPDRLEHSGPGGGPIEVTTYSAMTDEELSRRAKACEEALQNALGTPRNNDLAGGGVSLPDTPEARYAALLAVRKAGGNGNGSNGNGQP